MIVDQLNSELTGGAAVAGCRLHETLLELGVQSRFWCKKLPRGFSRTGFAELRFPRTSRAVTARAVGLYRFGLAKLGWRIDKWRYLRGRRADLERFSTASLAYPTPFDPNILSGDVLQLHWTTKFLDVASFFANLPSSHPIVWTQHDMSAFTGGCHHADGCEAFTSHCGNCPQLVRSHNWDLSRRSFATRLAAMQAKNLHIVTPSKWLERLVRRSRIFSAARTVQTIYNGLNLREYFPEDKAKARRELDLPLDTPIVAFGAGWLPNRRKGFVEYAAAMSRLAGNRGVLGLVFGEGPLPQESLSDFPMRRVGFLDNHARQRLVYSAADIFVLSSLGENLAQTGVESLACGTPVVSFDVGGLAEYVRPGETGFHAPLGNVEQLSRHVAWMLDHPDRRVEMGFAGRKLVEREFDHVRQAQKYVALYEAVTHASRRAA